jgi:hypothetical protein
VEILSEIIELSNEMIDTLDESGFFEEHVFLERLPLKRKLQIVMQRKWEQEGEIKLSDSEFLSVCNSAIGDNIADTLGSLVNKGAVYMNVDSTGEISYTANKGFDLNNI